MPADGGPAFPARSDEHYAHGATITAHHGMSLRDYFAGQFASRLLEYFLSEGSDDAMRDAASDAYNLADAMLKAREKSNA